MTHNRCVCRFHSFVLLVFSLKDRRMTELKMVQRLRQAINVSVAEQARSAIPGYTPFSGWIHRTRSTILPGHLESVVWELRCPGGGACAQCVHGCTRLKPRVCSGRAHKRSRFETRARVTISSMLVSEKPDSENKLNAASSMRWRMDPAGYVF